MRLLPIIILVFFTVKTYAQTYICNFSADRGSTVHAGKLINVDHISVSEVEVQVGDNKKLLRSKNLKTPNQGVVVSLLDGSDPDTISSPDYENKIILIVWFVPKISALKNNSYNVVFGSSYSNSAMSLVAVKGSRILYTKFSADDKTATVHCQLK
jgi:hypothetical protein